MIMKELYAQLGISSAVYDFGKTVEDSLKERFEKFDKTAEYNQMKVIHAMQKNRVSEACFGASSGYGYNDLGRETLEQVYAARKTKMMAMRTADWPGPPILTSAQSVSSRLLVSLGRLTKTSVRSSTS